MKLKRVATIGFVLLLTFAMVGCGTAKTSPGTDKKLGPVTVGSKIDTEGGVLGQIMIAALKNGGFEVVDRTKTGQTDVVRKALTSSEIDIYPEYTGTALTQFFPGAAVEAGVSKDAQASYDLVKTRDAANGIVWLERAPANNTWAIAIPKALSDSEGIKTLADWAAYINKGGAVKLVASQEFIDRAEDGVPAIEKAYGFKLKSAQLIVLAGGDTAQTEAAAAQGTNGANASMAYGTDGNLSALGLVVLEDPKSIWPVYEPAPTVRAEVLTKYPEIATILDPIFKGLTLATLQELNGKVSVDGAAPATVATDYLKSKGLIK
ncbi:MAG: osmoprotectant transport system substrate-binding [Actinobacteria bacterium]|nr:MAG: osmoprotectant transport system substrate-binding [Actinomycetota bacterium]MDO8950212.1 glycine betaine ABC transporter substrate-binding protein [Actinomycetota bacterium]